MLGSSTTLGRTKSIFCCDRTLRLYFSGLWSSTELFYLSIIPLIVLIPMADYVKLEYQAIFGKHFSLYAHYHKCNGRHFLNVIRPGQIHNTTVRLMRLRKLLNLEHCFTLFKLKSNNNFWKRKDLIAETKTIQYIFFVDM